MGEWIEIAKEPPSKDDLILMYEEDAGISLGWVDGDGKLCEVDHLMGRLFKPTHWLPIPGVPSGVTEDAKS